jgi:hypothetical protein
MERLETEGHRTQGWLSIGWARPIQLTTDRSTFFIPSLTGQLQVGTTRGEEWTRQHVEASLALRGSGPQLALRSARGRVTGDGAPFESFALGGSPSLILSDRVLSQTVPIPYLTRGSMVGEGYTMLEAAVRASALGEFFIARHRVSEGEDRTVRAVGIRSVERIPMLPMVRIPGGTLDGGSAYVMADPRTDERGHFRSWIAVQFRP